jgi:haloacetate dehalogenase
MAAMALFPGFASRRFSVGDYEIFSRMGGSGPPLLLLHGYPETHACWHRIAPRLAERFRVIVADLPGYGASRGPAREAAYAKRAMAEAFVDVMEQLGHSHFSVVGHDRGGRVAYRLALDHPDRVERLAALSILPTFAMWRRLKDNDYAMQAFRWYSLAQPSALPEDMIEASAMPYLHATLSGWTADKSLAAFAPEALAAYEAAFAMRSVITASCADYRTGWTKDRQDDEADLAAGRVIACSMLLLWGRREFPDVEHFLAAWRPIAPGSDGQAMDCGHFLPEEAPDETAEALSGFLVGHRRPANP